MKPYLVETDTDADFKSNDGVYVVVANSVGNARRMVLSEINSRKCYDREFITKTREIKLRKGTKSKIFFMQTPGVL